MMTPQDIPLYEEVVNGFNRLSAADALGRESSDLRKTRQSAFERFRESGFPTIRNEDWKYTNIARFLKEEYVLAGEGTFPVAESVRAAAERARVAELDAYIVLLVNGVWQKEEGGGLPKGVELLTVAEARQDPALSGYFERQADGKER